MPAVSPFSEALSLAKSDVTSRGSYRAGKMLYDYIRSTSPSSVAKYVSTFKTILDPGVATFMMKHAKELDTVMADFKVTEIQWMSADTFNKAYLTSLPTTDLVENIEQCWMRVSCYFAMRDGVDSVVNCYKSLINGNITPPSPVIFNGGKLKGTECSCFLLKVDDNLDSIFETQLAFSKFSAAGGGIGINMSALRTSDLSTGGQSCGQTGWGKLYDASFNQIRRSYRKAAGTLFCNWYNLEVLKFIGSSVKSQSDHERTYHSASTAVWTSYLFFRRAMDNKDITLFCAKYTSHLDNLFMDDFNRAYVQLEMSLDVPEDCRKTISARRLLNEIASCRVNSGAPFVLNFDAASFRSMHRMSGTPDRVHSNLCVEMMMRIPKVKVGKEEKRLIAVCNLSSINLASLVTKRYAGDFKDCVDFETLASSVHTAVRNINNSIEITKDPLEGHMFKTIMSNAVTVINKLDKAIGLGVMGFADMIYRLDLIIGSEEVYELNKIVFACIYWNAMLESVRLAAKYGAHESFRQTPLALGKFDFDLWNEESEHLANSKFIFPEGVEKETKFKLDLDKIVPVHPSVWGQTEGFSIRSAGESPSRYASTWEDLSYAVIRYGTRNSLLTAIMPTATSSQCRGLSEGTEIPQTNFYGRVTLSGTYLVFNQELERDLVSKGLWDDRITRHIAVREGSVQYLCDFMISELGVSEEHRPFLERLQKKYATAFEIDQSVLIRLMKERSPYISHSQSFSSFNSVNTVQDQCSFIVKSMYSRAKTIAYYSRSGLKAEGEKDRSSRIKLPDQAEVEEPGSESKASLPMMCDGDTCTACSS